MEFSPFTTREAMPFDFILLDGTNRFIGSLFVKPSSRPSDILPQLRTLAGFHAHEEIDLFEEVKFAPVLCVKVDIDSTFSSTEIENGDIICYQKIPKSEDTYPYVRLFFEHNRLIVLDFSLEHLQQATDHFSDVWKVGDTEYGCYEWLPNGNLEDCILRTDNSPPLLWYNRAQIIAEVCCMLQFLHSNKPGALVHGDLRPCNILIDANYRSKLCHFGMSDLFLEPGTCPPNMSARLPYMDPEFLTTWELTPLSDVYSLGAIILRRLLTGMPPLSIAKKVAAALKSNSLHLLIEKSAGDWPYTQAEQLALLGLRCVKMSRERRPDLSTKVWKVIEPMIMKPPVASWPCFQEIMNDPQVAADGFTYEAEGIRHWLDEGNNRSPMTNMALPNQDLIPNRALRSWIQEYLQQQKQQQGRLDS
ncbi:hypothetical protein SETIT_9G361500v2 [Setaria italica]|uniref:RING-type E3 ubiquitin transferase n=1 Tax=Setaria italica TaxID=4555 RepID=K4ALX2_SETIT|nr:hypothetical protein SETIT_9G361500v2 [Setaria italica]